jgi:hypothetical protein
MILKVQISVAQSGEVKFMLIYNKGRGYLFEGPATPAVLRAMDGEVMRYFDAELDAHRRFILVERAPEQAW